MLSLPRRGAPTYTWADVVEPIIMGYADGEVAFFDPTAPASPYDATADTGGYTAALFLFKCPAIIQPLRTPLDIPSQTQWSTSRGIQLQITQSATSTLIRHGLIVRVLNGGGNTDLEKISMTVLAAVNSSHGGLRIVDCKSELADTPAIAVP